MGYMYKMRVREGKCVGCACDLEQNYTKRRCGACLTKRNMSRTDKVVDRERKYRQKCWDKRCVWKSARKDRLCNKVSEHPTITAKRLRTLRILQNNKCFYYIAKIFILTL